MSKILIIDDAPEIVTIIEDLLAAKGFATVSAATAEVGLTLVDRERPDLILLDLMLPGMDGFTFCRKIKSQDATKGIKIIMVSVLRDGKDKKKGFEVGADDYVTKPFNPDDLILSINKQLGNG
jgi:DNA-binding response OmpR family regulator